MKLHSKKVVGGDMYLFTFQPEFPIAWKAGQQMAFTLKHPNPDNLGSKRILSIASAPFEENISVLTHCSERGSTFKKALRSMEDGDVIEAGEPEGDFVMKDPEKEHMFIAAGVGISPFRSILADLDYHSLPINVTLLYSNPDENFPFKEEIEEWLERHENFKVYYTVDPDWKERGRIKEVVTGLQERPIYMSGIYVRKIAQMLDHRDVSPRRVVHDGRQLIGRSKEVADEESYLRSLCGE